MPRWCAPAGERIGVFLPHHLCCPGASYSRGDDDAAGVCPLGFCNSGGSRMRYGMDPLSGWLGVEHPRPECTTTWPPPLVGRLSLPCFIGSARLSACGLVRLSGIAFFIGVFFYSSSTAARCSRAAVAPTELLPTRHRPNASRRSALQRGSPFSEEGKPKRFSG